MKKVLSLLTAAVVCISMFTACGEADSETQPSSQTASSSETESIVLEKSKYTKIENPEFIQMNDNRVFPTDFDKIQFDLDFWYNGDDKFGYHDESAANILEVKNDGEWYVIPNKKDYYRSQCLSLNSSTYHPFSFSKDDYDYDFKDGEYRYILRINRYDGNEEKQTPAVFHFKLTDRNCGKFFRPYEDIRKGDIKRCTAKGYYSEQKELTDEQTDELLDIIKDIELVRGSERPNDYLGGPLDDFVITLKSGKTIGICASIGSVCEFLLDDGTVYHAVESKHDELQELYLRLCPIPETSEDSK